jgi:hypothetical protein
MCAPGDHLRSGGATNSAERTVQYALRRLEADGLIRRTGEMHTLNEGSRFPRKVPIFQIAPGVEGVDPLAASGAKSAPEPDALGCKAELAGVQLGAPRNELIRTDTPSDEGDARARELAFETAGSGLSEARVGLHQPGPGAGEFWRLLDDGIDVEGLIRAAGLRRRQGRSSAPTRASTTGWPTASTGAGGRSRSWRWSGDAGRLGRDREVAPHAAPEADQAVWRTWLERLAEALNEGEFGSYIRPLTLCAGRVRPGRAALHVVALTGHARDWIKARCLAAHLHHFWAEADARSAR